MQSRMFLSLLWVVLLSLGGACAVTVEAGLDPEITDASGDSGSATADGGDTSIEVACIEGNAASACNDNNPCTQDSCENEQCVNIPTTAVCDDGNECTENDACADGACVGSSLNCDDGEFCTVDKCEQGSGCIHVSKDGVECDDGDVCTTAGICQIGSCAGVTPISCHDLNDCTIDSCDPAKGCKNKLIVSQACRPNIVVDYPPRAAGVIWEDLSVPTLTVTGTVKSGAGPITEFTLNGAEVSVADDGSFSTEITPNVGGNTLEFDAEDSMKSARKRVQSFHWSPGFIDPKVEEVALPCAGQVADGVCITAYLDSGSLWGPAEQKCVALGGHLAVIHSEAQNDAVKAQRESVCGEKSAWIGMNDNVKEGNYVWADGSEIDFTYWAENEPNDWEGDEDVIGMYASGFWNDFNGDVVLKCHVCTSPTTEKQYTGHADPGMGIFIGPELLDDGDHGLPANDLATVFEVVLGEFDIAKLIPNPAAKDVSASGGTYDIYLKNVQTAKPTVALSLIDGGWTIMAKIKNVKAGIEALKTQGSFFLPGKITGTLKIKTITILADVLFAVTPDHELDAWVEKTDVSIDGVSVDINGILGPLIENMLGGSVGSMMEDMEKQIGDELGNALAPMLVDALGSLALGFDFELPSVNPEAAPVQMKVATDFSWVDFKTDGDLLALRSIAVPDDVVVTHESKGAPARSGCGLVEQKLAILKEAPMEIVMNDDTVNLIFYSAWRGGFLEFDLPPALLGDFDLESIGVKDLVAHISGLLAPAVSDCKNGVLLLHIGDIMFTATMDFAGSPLDIEAYASFDAKFEILVVDGQISFGVNDIANVKLELTALQDEQIGVEPLLTNLIQQNLVPALMDGLSGDALGGLPLPDVEMDTGGVTVKIGIDPLWVKRVDGNNLVGAKLIAN